MSGYSFIERLQAARHSTFVMCVAASQKPMQSASDLPPPPGLLGADWLGLLLPDEVLPGERASEEPPEEPPPVSGLTGRGSDMGDSGATVDPVVGAVGEVVAATPAPGGIGPAEGVVDNDVEGAAGVVRPEDTLGAVRKVADGTETLGLGAAPTDERACASAMSGSSNNKVTAPKACDLSVSIAITMALRPVPHRGQRSAATFVAFTTLRAARGQSDGRAPPEPGHSRSALTRLRPGSGAPPDTADTRALERAFDRLFPSTAQRWGR